MTPAEQFAQLERNYQRLYGHLTDDELHAFYKRGMIRYPAYLTMCVRRGIKL
jgi:hypothetical protein